MSQFNTLVVRICRTGDALQSDCVALTALAASMPFVEFRNKAARIIGTTYGVKPHTSQLKGWLTFDKDTGPEQKLSAICKLHPNRPEAGQTRGKVAAPARLVSNIKRQIIDAGLTKAEMNALFAALREEIAFK